MSIIPRRRQAARRAQPGGGTMGPQAHTSLPWVLPAYVQHFAFIVHRPAVYSIFVRHGPAPSKGDPGRREGGGWAGKQKQFALLLFPFGFSFLLLAFQGRNNNGWDRCFLPYHRANRDGGPARRPMGHGSANIFYSSHGSWSTANVRVCVSGMEATPPLPNLTMTEALLSCFTALFPQPDIYLVRGGLRAKGSRPSPPNTPEKRLGHFSYLSGYEEEHRRGGG